jgi:hypothetical protein
VSYATVIDYIEFPVAAGGNMIAQTDRAPDGQVLAARAMVNCMVLELLPGVSPMEEIA